jgi:CheY-like chemotaxis protein
MSKTPTIRLERRGSARFSPKGTVLFRGEAGLEHGRLSNLSRGGMLVATPHPDEWLPMSGRIRRIGVATLAIELVTASPSFVQLVDDSSTASERDVQILSVLLVDATTSRRVAVADAFRAVGCSVLEASTPLEAIVRLGEAQFEPDLIVIADSAPSATSDDLRRFVEREHPDAKLVTVGDELVDPAGLLPWLSSANLEGDMVARVQELLSRPRRA